MQKRDFDTKTKVDILKFMLENQLNEVNFRREREYRIFTWSSSILLALIGGLLIYRQESGLLLNSYGLIGRVIVSATVILLVFFSIAWQNRNNKYRGQNAQTISHISKLLHCYDEGFYDPENNSTLFRKEWADYGKGHTRFKARFFHANFVTATFLLGVLSILMIWATR
jgi:hypothetical protein